MIGLRYWIWIWYAILVLGAVGFGTAVYWGRRTGWKNLDEILRGFGTVAVSLGMLVLLHRAVRGVGQVLLVVALAAFVLAFALGRRLEDGQAGDGSEEDGG